MGNCCRPAPTKEAVVPKTEPIVELVSPEPEPEITKSPFRARVRDSVVVNRTRIEHQKDHPLEESTPPALLVETAPGVTKPPPPMPRTTSKRGMPVHSALRTSPSFRNNETIAAGETAPTTPGAATARSVASSVAHGGTTNRSHGSITSAAHKTGDRLEGSPRSHSPDHPAADGAGAAAARSLPVGGGAPTAAAVRSPSGGR